MWGTHNHSSASSGAKKSLYVFLCSLLGALLFLIIHRLAVFAYLVMVSANPQVFGGLNYLELLAIDFFTLFLALLLGSWYGIWLGLKWYEQVYEHPHKPYGFVDHVIEQYWPTQKHNFNLEEKVKSVAEEIKEDVLELENISKTIKPVLKVIKPVRRRIVRKRAVKSKA
jgi:hypothetical protein